MGIEYKCADRHHLTFSERPWRQAWHRYTLYLVAVAVAALLLLPVSINYNAGASDAYKPAALNPVPDFSKGLRCSDSPADCEIAAPFIFDSIYALAKQWPNTYAPNGHSILPVTFPIGMPLYHANQNEKTVKIPTWFAFDW